MGKGFVCIGRLIVPSGEIARVAEVGCGTSSVNYTGIRLRAGATSALASMRTHFAAVLADGT